MQPVFAANFWTLCWGFQAIIVVSFHLGLWISHYRHYTPSKNFKTAFLQRFLTPDARRWVFWKRQIWTHYFGGWKFLSCHQCQEPDRSFTEHIITCDVISMHFGFYGPTWIVPFGRARKSPPKNTPPFGRGAAMFCFVAFALEFAPGKQIGSTRRK